MLEWKDAYSVGNPAVDHEHRELIDLVTRIEWRYLDGGADPGAGWEVPDYDDSRWKRRRTNCGRTGGNSDRARGLGVGVHIHAAEDPVDAQITRDRFGSGLIERFERVGLLDVPGTILAHGTHFSDRDFAAVNERAGTVWLAHNPSSNMNNGVGRTPIGWLGDRVALGTDGIGGDLFEESRSAFLRRREEELPEPAPASS